MKTLQKLISKAVIASLITTFGCKLMQPPVQTAPISPPKTFQSESDSAGIGSLPWQSLFSDPKLSALIGNALQNNPDLKIAAQRIEMARSGLLLSRGAMLPSAGAEISAGGRKFGDYTMDGVGNYDTNFSDNLDSDRKLPAPFLPDYFVGLRSSWEIDVWGKLKARKKAAYNRLLASEKARHVVITGLIAEIASGYYRLVALDNELEIIRKNIELQQSAVETVKIQKEAGRANELAVRQLTAQFINTKSLEVQAEQQIIAQENSLNLLMGRFPAPIERIKLTQQAFPEKVSAGIPATMLKRRPDIRQAQLEMQAYYSDQQAAQLAFLPSLNITALLGFNAFKSSLLFSPGSIAYGAAGGLLAPLVNRKALKANRRSAQAQSQAALYQYEKAVLNGFQEVSTSLQNLEQTRKILRLKSDEVLVLQQGVSISKDLYLSGYASYLEVILAQRNVLDAELELAQVTRNQFLALIELYRSLGGGWE